MGSGRIKNPVFLAVTLAVIANLLFAGGASAKKLEISDKDAGRIKIGLDIAKIITNIAVSDDKLKTVLNLTLEGGKTGTEVTYGLLVLSSLNEMDFIDSVVSQRYKAESSAYFNGILDEQLNLRNYYQGIGFDIPRVLAGGITGPMAALTLNTFDMSSKAIQIFTAFEVLKKTKIYNGLFVYFDFRKGNEAHEFAWEMARAEMGWAGNIDIEKKSRFIKGKSMGVSSESQLEQQFASLYEKWGQYIEINKGIKKEFKEQVKKEWGNAIALAVESHKFAEEKPKTKIWDRIMASIDFIKKEIGQLNNKIKELAIFGGAQIIQVIKTEPAANPVDVKHLQEKEKTLVKDNKPVATSIEVKPQYIIELEKEPQGEPREETQEEIKEETKAVLEQGELPAEGEARSGERRPEKSGREPEKAKTEAKPMFCQKIVGSQPLRNSVIFSEIAWMGSQNSANDEWFKLKNISEGDINLSGWQVLDKDGQIKIVLINGNRISINGTFLLERTDDNSLTSDKADFIYTGSLNDNNEELYLFDVNCQLRDEVLANPDWPTGDKENRVPAKRNIDLTWAGVSSPSPAPIFNYGTPIPPPPESPAPPSPTYLKILISEVQISPISERFVELYNPNNESVNLSGWYLQRKTETGSSFNSFVTSTQFEGKTIGPLSYFLIASSSQADIILGLTMTEGNFLVFKNPNQEIVDEISWENPTSSQSTGRKWLTGQDSYADSDVSSADFEIQTPTPKARNQSQLVAQNQNPSAVFAFIPAASPTVGQETIFDASSSTDSDGTITAYMWDFGADAAASTSQATTSYSFATSGDFLVTLVIKDEQNATSSAATATVSVVAIAEIPSLSVVVNEIAWMGTGAGATDEWLELFNNSSSSIDLLGWTLTASDGSPAITFSTSSGTTTISANGFYLLERTNSTTTSVAEDFIFTGALNNDGEKLALRDASSTLIDLVDFSAGWPAGTTTPNYISMERISAASSSWASNNLITRNGLDALGKRINGTPKAQNSVSKSQTEIFNENFVGLTSEFSQINLISAGSPYIIQESLILQASNTLKIDPGVTLKFKDATEMEIRGNLEAISGESEQKITFTRNSTTSLPDDRYRLYFSASSNSKIENAEFIDGGRLTYVPFIRPWGYISGVLDIEDSNVSVKNSLISQAFPRAIYTKNSTTVVDSVEISDVNNSESFLNTAAILADSGSLEVKNSNLKRNTIGVKIGGVSSSTISNNNFQDNNKIIYLDSGYSPVFANNSAQNNGVNGISVGAASIVADTVWQSNLPYVIEESKTISGGVTLTLASGTAVKFNPEKYLYIHGKLLAQGIAENPAVFTSIYDDEYGGDTNNDATATAPYKGSWKYLEFDSLDSVSVLDGIILRYGSGYCSGGGSCFGAITKAWDTNIEIKNSRIEKNTWGITTRYGVCADFFSQTTIQNTIFSDNTKNIYIYGVGEDCAIP